MIPRRRFLGGLVALPLLAVSCGGDDESRAIDPADPGDVEVPGLVARDVSYGDHELQALSVWWSELTPSPRPVLVWCHPGGWFEGDRFDVWSQRTVTALCTRGWAVATIDYRLAPEVQWPAFGDDVRAAVDLVRLRAGDWELDASRCCLGGASAGGQIAAWGGSTIEGIAAVVTQYGFPDLTNPAAAARDLVAQAFGPPADPRRAEASPLTVAAGAPPTLHVYGREDPLVPVEQGRAYAAALDDAGVDNELVVLAGSHAEVAHIPDYLVASADFLDRRVRLA